MQKLLPYKNGVLLCVALSVPAWFLGTLFPVVGGPVFAIVLGMVVTLFIKNKAPFNLGITFVSKKILQYAVVLLGFGLNLNVILHTGKQSLPIIASTISIALIVAFVMCKCLRMHTKIATLIGVGSAICGGSAIAATAPVIDASDDEVAQAISVIFFYNVLAALLFPTLGSLIGFSTTSPDAFALFAGTAVNDTSSVTATASTWDTLYHFGSATLDKAVTVKLTRTLAIIPITLSLAFYQAKTAQTQGKKVALRKIFPFFILFFILASCLTTALINFGVPATAFAPIKTLSKYFIVLAMVAIGLNTNVVKLVKTGLKPLSLGFACWLAISLTSIALQKWLNLF